MVKMKRKIQIILWIEVSIKGYFENLCKEIYISITHAIRLKMFRNVMPRQISFCIEIDICSIGYVPLAIAGITTPGLINIFFRPY